MEHPMRDWSRNSKDRLCGSYDTAINSDECSVDFSVDFDPQDAAATAVPTTGDVNMLSVRVTLCATENAAAACKMALKTHTPPRQAPAADVLRAPIWTTWARYKTKVNESKVLKYAREIADRGLPRSVMEIDDRWQTSYGELSFDEKKFPDPRAMVDELHNLGFKVTVWVHPFVEEKSAAFQEGAAKGYFVGTDAARSTAGGFMSWLRGVGSPPVIPVAPGGSAPGFFAWWNQPPVAALDVTNPEAVEWFVGRLKALQAATGIDGFKFDAGEPCFLPRNPQTHAPLTTPADYTRLYVKNVAGQFAGGVSEVRTGHLTQDVAVLCRMGDRFSTWDAGNGLRSLIPTLLTSGVLGYPFCLPDLVGGNRYFGAAPDSELLVRWTQASVLMPTLQFSIPPWDLDLDAERMVAGALDVRKKMEGLLLSLADEAAHTLTPICRPLWMLAPHDDQTYEIHDQFALGDHVIVAPVVHKGARRRDVYLTDGLWRDVMNPSVVVKGGQWLRGISTPLDYLPVFVKEGAPGVFF
jgi:alpha-glucosidase (family GH31 glycosyl hydrolase)